ncbi:MAG: hypothetical protein WAN46_14065 [Gammaproteobacteria bacterium]
MPPEEALDVVELSDRLDPFPSQLFAAYIGGLFGRTYRGITLVRRA